eukprot:1158617-Pelagomonas_calceolata.AAC.4
MRVLTLLLFEASCFQARAKQTRLSAAHQMLLPSHSAKEVMCRKATSLPGMKAVLPTAAAVAATGTSARACAHRQGSSALKTHAEEKELATLRICRPEDRPPSRLEKKSKEVAVLCWANQQEVRVMLVSSTKGAGGLRLRNSLSRRMLLGNCRTYPWGVQHWAQAWAQAFYGCLRLDWLDVSLTHGVLAALGSSMGPDTSSLAGAGCWAAGSEAVAGEVEVEGLAGASGEAA